MSARVEELLARYIERHIADGTRLPCHELCSGEPQLEAELQVQVAAYHSLDETMAKPTRSRSPAAGESDEALPTFPGFRTIERIGQGGMGAVYKLEDLKLHRIVAAKVVRDDRATRGSMQDFLKEARTLALFEDPRIVRIFELRSDSDPPVIIMEHVDGFRLTEIAPSLEFTQRARLVAEMADALARAHELRITHRDLKPDNILVDRRLQPRILDFGLASANPHEGHGAGTAHYIAPEQLDPRKAIDARTDVHALGVILYEVLAGQRPYEGDTQAEVLAAVLAGRPSLPCEIEPACPEPLQAIALKAMETSPANRYATAREMAQDLRRWLAGKPVLARPTLYASALEQRVHPHLMELDEWQRLKLVHPHEVVRLKSLYRRLDSREEDWMVQGRSLAWSQIALYFGAFLATLSAGFATWFFVREEAATWLPLVVMGAPWLVLNAAGWRAWQGPHRAVSVALHVASMLLLPLYLVVQLSLLKWLAAGEKAREQMLGEFDISDRQLQLAFAIGAGWALLLAWRTRTVALSVMLAVLAALAHLALMTEWGLYDIVEDPGWDRLAARLLPLLLLYCVTAVIAEHARRTWLSSPLYVAAAVALVACLELAAQGGKLFQHLGVTLQGLQSGEVKDVTLIDTLGAMSLAGLVMLLVGDLAERTRSESMRMGAQVLLVVAPFAMLEPLWWLNKTEDYSLSFCWAYLVASLAVIALSRLNQRRAFYHSGLLNVGAALVFIADRHEWLGKVGWPMSILAAALMALAGGAWLNAREHESRPPSS